MDVVRKENGRWELRWREAGRRRSRTFDRKAGAVAFESDRVRRRQLGHAAVPDDVRLAQFVETYWRLHAVPNLAPSTREFYKRTWVNHIMPRLGDYGVRELTPKRLARSARSSSAPESASRRCASRWRSSIDPVVRGRRGARRVQCGRVGPQTALRTSTRAAHLLPTEVERIRHELKNLRDRTLVAVLAYSGPRPEEVVFRLAWEDIGERTIRYRDTKRHRVRFTPLLAPLGEDLREWFLASGRPAGNRPVFPAHDGDFWTQDDWRNWRSRIWRGEERPANRRNEPTYPGVAPAGTRPRDLRSSFITLQVYAGVPLTTIAKQCGTSVTMIEKHYAGVIENWDGVQQPAEAQIRAARQTGGRSVDVTSVSGAGRS